MILQEAKAEKKETKAVDKADRNRRADTAEAGPSSQAAAAANGSRRAPNGVIGKTVFVRGLGNEMSKQQLQARLESFGPVKACR